MYSTGIWQYLCTWTSTLPSLSCSVCNSLRALKILHSYINVLSVVRFNYHNRLITEDVVYIVIVFVHLSARKL